MLDTRTRSEPRRRRRWPGRAAPDRADAALPVVRSFAEVVALAGERREAKLKVHLEEHVSLVKFDPAGSIELHLLAGAPKELGNELREKLNAWTGRRWMVALSKAPGERPLGEVEREREAAEICARSKKHPAVAAVLQAVPRRRDHQRAAAAGQQERRHRTQG